MVNETPEQNRTEGQPSLPVEKELAAFLKGLKIEYEATGTEELDCTSTDLMFTYAVETAIKTWASFWEIPLKDDDLCEPDSNVYASGMDFEHTANFTCYGILPNGKHIHVSWKFGHVGPKNYFHIDEVLFEGDLAREN